MKIKKSTFVPLILLAYLAVMAYIGLPHLQAGRYFYYFGIIAATLIIIVLLHFTLKYMEKRKAAKEDANTYTTYAKNGKDADSNDDRTN